MKAIVIISAMLLGGVASAAPTQKAVLDGGKYRIVTIENGKPQRDTPRFDKGTMHSSECDPYGFAPGAYTAKKNGDLVEFEATIKSKTEGAILWKGTVKNGKIAGKLVWTKPKQNAIEYAFDGQLDRASEVAAAARGDIEKTFGFVPTFLARTSDHALPGAWDEMKTLQMNPSTALKGKVKELIGLAVASQVPCTYCVFAHTEFAQLNGANDDEVSEAIAMAALTRHWSTYLNGMQLDRAAFSKDIAKLIEGAKKMTPKPELQVVDAKSARADMERAFGFVPGFVGQFPDVGLAGAWREMRDLQLSNTTALGMKEKELVGLAVASQIPCHYCVEAHTAFAKLGGATEEEIKEAVAMAALTRHWSTILNGTQIDQAAFQREIQKLITGLRGKRQS